MAETAEVILLVDDDIVVRHPLAEYLRSCGFKVHEASSGEEAKQFLAAEIIRINFVLADMTTPGSGFALRDWCSKLPDPPVVMLAGSVDKEVENAGSLCNDGPALRKPWDHRLVLENIRQLMARRDRSKE